MDNEKLDENHTEKHKPEEKGEDKADKKQITSYLCLAGVVIFLVIVQFLIVNSLITLPSPLYGGDYYYQLGQVNHVKYGGSPLESGNINGDLPGYFVLYSAGAGFIARVFSIDAIKAEYAFSYLIIILSAIVLFFMIKKLFKNVFLSIMGVLVFLTAGTIPVMKYTIMAHALLMPALLLLTYYFINKPSVMNSIFLGIVYGLIGLTHSIAFISASFLLLAVFIYYGLLQKKSVVFKKPIQFKKILEMLWPYAMVLVIGVAIALLWWFKPLFSYSLGQNNLYRNALLPDWGSLSYQFRFIWDFIKTTFFNFSGIRAALLSIFTIIGTIGFFIVKKDNPGIRYIRFLFVTSLILTFHFLLTQNILHFNFAPNYIQYLLLDPVIMLVFVFGIYLSYQFIKKIKLDQKMQAFVKYAFFSIIILLLLIGQYQALGDFKKDKWYAVGQSPLPENMVELSKYLVANTNVHDTIMSANEISFALNALSGRKLLVTRRAQNDAWTDMDSRQMAAAIILYGNDTQVIKELLKKYDVKYFYWDSFWVQAEYSFNQQGQMTGWFDPLVVFDSQEREETLNKNNVSFFTQNTWLDPAANGPDFKKFNLIFISPANYNNFTHPWKPNLDSYLQEVWNYSQNGQVASRLYKITGID